MLNRQTSECPVSLMTGLDADAGRIVTEPTQRFDQSPSHRKSARLSSQHLVCAAAVGAKLSALFHLERPPTFAASGIGFSDARNRIGSGASGRRSEHGRVA